MSIFSIIKSEIQELDWKHSWWPVLFGIVAISPTIGAIPPTTPLYYALLIFTGLLYLYKTSRICKLMLVFLVACYVSVLLGHPAEIFQSHIRVTVFTIVILVASPLVQSDYVRNFRQRSLYVILKACVLVALISFVFYFLGINYMQALSEDISYIGNAGLFGGLTRQSMLLGPMSGVATVYCAYKALRTKQKWYWAIAIPCIACTMFAASRAAFLASIAGILVMFYTFTKSRSQFIKILFTFLVIGAVSFPLWESAMDGLQEKNQRNVETGSALNSRNEKWDNRIKEFNSSPLTGIGFFSCDTKNIEDYSEAGGIEPGSSWLAILSMTGLFGFIPFCLLMRNSIRNAWRRRTEDSALLMGLIAFISLHMLAEGYIIACGSPFCFMAWLIIACNYDRQYFNEIMKPIYLVITPFFPSPTKWQGAYILDQVKAIRRISDYEIIVIHPQSSKFKTEKYEVDGVIVHRFSIINTPSYFFNGAFNGVNSRRFIRFIEKLGIDCSQIKYIHTHTGPYAVYGSALKRVAPQAKVFVQHHDLDIFNVRNGKWAQWKPNALYRAHNCQRLYKDVDLHICISTPVKDSLLAFPKARKEEVYQSYLDALQPVAQMSSIAPSKIYILYNGVDTELFQPMRLEIRGQKLENRIFRIGCVANFNELKDHKSLVEAFKILVEKGYKDMRLSLLGTGEKRAETEAFLKEHNLYELTEWPSEVTHDKLPEYYHSLDLFVLPSYFEGFGCVYTEAYACGVPFIGVYHQGAAECIAPEEKDKWLVQPKNPMQLAERIERYYKERDKQHLCQPYDINELIKSFLKYIESL